MFLLAESPDAVHQVRISRLRCWVVAFKSSCWPDASSQAESEGVNLESFQRLPHRFDETLGTVLHVIGASDSVVEHSGSDPHLVSCGF